jgi:hypothetical protein
MTAIMSIEEPRPRGTALGERADRRRAVRRATQQIGVQPRFEKYSAFAPGRNISIDSRSQEGRLAIGVRER